MAASDSPAVPCQPALRRRWPRFGLRALLLAVTILAIVLGRQVNRAARQRAVVATVEDLGGFVRYDFEVEGASAPAIPRWLGPVLGTHLAARVVHVYLSGPQVNDAVLERLKDLGKLRLVVLENTRVTPAGVEAFRQAVPGCLVSET